MNDCSIFLISCDKYAFVAEQNLFFFKKYWPNCPFPIYVGLERKKIKDLSITNLNSTCIHWSERIIEQLNNIPTKYILIILDDFFLEEPVNEKLIMESLDLIQHNLNYANVSLMNYIGKKEKCINNKFEIRSNNRPSLVNWQVGFWDKEKLISLLVKNENPWESELYGSLRAQYLFDYNFLCLSSDVLMPYKYGKGWLIVRGTWNINEVKRIEEKCKIEINVGNLPQKKIKKIKNPLFVRLKNRLKLKKYELYLRRKNNE